MLRNPVRIACLLPDTDDAGAENQTRYLLSALRDRQGVEAELVYFAEGRGHDAFVAAGLDMRQVPRRRRLVLDGHRRARALRGRFGAQPPDVLHTWLVEANIVGLLAARAWPRTGVVVTQRGGLNERGYGA